MVINKLYEINGTHNLSIVLSSWTNLTLPKRTAANWYPIAWFQDGTEKRISKDTIECFGNCEYCGMCWNLSNLKRDVVFYKH
jgi:hypothetical protein